MKHIEKILTWGMYAFVFLLPWQTRYIFESVQINGGSFQFGTLSIYVTEVLLWLLAAGTLLYRLRRPTLLKGGRRLVPFYFVMALFAFLSIFSVWWAIDVPLAIQQALHIAEGVVLVLLVLYLPVEYEKVGMAFFGAGVVQAGIGIYQFIVQKITASTLFGIAAQLPQTLGVSVVDTGAFRWLRAYGAFPHPNVLGAFLAICLIIGAILLIGSSSFKERSLYWAGEVILIAGLFFSFSKGALLALGVGGVLLFVFILFLKDYEAKLLFSQFIFVAITVLGLLGILYNDIALTRLFGQERLETQSVTQRLDYIRDAQEIIAYNWLFGVGAGNYTVALMSFQPGSPGWAYQPVHNVFLLLLAELGVLGFMVLAWMIIEALKIIYNYRLEYTVDLIQIFKEKQGAEDKLNLYQDYVFSAHWFLAYSAIFFMLLTLFFFDHFLWTLYFGVILFWLVFGLWLKQVAFMKK